MFTCISCKVAFESADEQRSHFSTDWHRYNMKRRVADLPPLPAVSFNEKVLERREQNAIRTDPRSLACAACSKSFASENAYRSHVQSKKHREREILLAQRGSTLGGIDAKAADRSNDEGEVQDEVDGKSDTSGDDEYDEDDEDGIEAKLAAYRRRIRPTDCLFCSSRTDTLEDVLAHMTRQHSFFIPDREHLTDLSGLLSYLGEKVVLGNLCLFCPNGGKEFGNVEAARQHMTDKAHCKMAYETDEDRAELLDFYDFGYEGDDWEDVDSDAEEEGPIPRTASLAPDGLSLVLPSGRVLGHRSLKVYYDQNLRPNSRPSPVDDKIKALRDRLADPTQALVPVAGGSGNFGRGLQVIKARNAGEARWAREQGRAFKEHRRHADFKMRVGVVHNNQKHFRDPLLQ